MIKDEIVSPPSKRHRAEWLSLDDFVEPITAAGGSMQLVCACINSSSEEQLAQKLSAFFEKMSDVSYSRKDVMLQDTDDELRFRLVDLGFNSHTTTKGPPRLVNCLSMLDNIYCSGFSTQLEPLRVWNNPKTMQLDSFWLSHVKGHLRATTALAMAIIIMDNYLDAAAATRAGGGTLIESLRVVRVRQEKIQPDIMAVAFQNAIISHRGSTRKTLDVLEWIEKLEIIRTATGQAADDVLGVWNKSCPQNARVVGNKQLCCLNILKKLDAPSRTLLLAHASTVGGKSFSDDAFTSKLIYPGYKPRLVTSKWIRWQSITHHSFLLMLKHLMHEQTVSGIAVSKAGIEKASKIAALVACLTEDVIEQNDPLPRSIIESTFVAAFIDNDPNLVLALEEAVQNQAKDYDPMQLPVLSEAVLDWRKSAPSTQNGATPLTMKVNAGELEEHEFKLWRLKVVRDVEQIDAWCRLVKDRKATQFYKKAQHNVVRAAECQAAALSLLDNHHRNCMVFLQKPDDEHAILKTIAACKLHAVKTQVLSSGDSVHTFVFLNWAAMSLFQSKVVKVQHSLMAQIVRQDGGENAMGLVLMPTHCNAKGKLHEAISKATAILASHGVFIDKSLAFHFDSFSDSTHSVRPALMPANLVLQDDEAKQFKTAMMKQAMKVPVVCLGEQVRNKDLIRREDPDADALPPSVIGEEDPGHSFSIAEKHIQIGPSACTKILSAFFNDFSAFETRYALMVVDLSVHVCDMVKAVLNGGGTDRPIFYVGLCTDDEHMAFVKGEIVHFVKTKLLTDDGFTIPGFTIPPKEMPQDDFSMPEPVLHVLAFNELKDAFKFKDADVAKWKGGIFQHEFEQLEAALKKSDALSELALTPGGVKHEAPGGVKHVIENGIPTDDMFIDAGSIQTQILHDVALSQKKGLVLKVCANHEIYLVNHGDSDSSITNGSIVVGYGKGKWGDATEPGAIKYELTSSSDSVMFNGKLATLGQLVQQKLLTHAADEARCCYFTMNPEDGNGVFDLIRKSDIFYIVHAVEIKREEGVPKAIQSNAGSLIPPEHWNTTFTKFMWCVNWATKKGLRPNRPQVTWVGPDTTIPSGKGLRLAPEHFPSV